MTALSFLQADFWRNLRNTEKHKRLHNITGKTWERHAVKKQKKDVNHHLNRR